VLAAKNRYFTGFGVDNWKHYCIVKVLYYSKAPTYTSSLWPFDTHWTKVEAIIVQICAFLEIMIVFLLQNKYSSDVPYWRIKLLRS
jgi:hypothetical protein